MKKIILIIILLNFLVACQSAKDALTLKKKSNSDEFLVEKKSPLVLPPDYGKLPLPKQLENMETKKNVNTQSFETNQLVITDTIKNSEPTEIEKSVLGKIKLDSVN